MPRGRASAARGPDPAVPASTERSTQAGRVTLGDRPSCHDFPRCVALVVFSHLNDKTVGIMAWKRRLGRRRVGAAGEPGPPVAVRARGSAGVGQRYWPVFATVSMVRPGSLPCLPWMIVRM